MLFNDEITEIKFLQDPYLLLSTNSEILKILNTETAQYELILGHSDIVVALDVHISEDYTVFISGAKDNTIRLWKITYSPLEVTCLAIYSGHTMNVTSISLDPKKGNYFVSVSLDKTLKKWGVHEHLENGEEKEVNEAQCSQIAHEKGVNVVRVSPGENNKVIATGSHDRTIKIWKATDLENVSTLKGHNRVIWDLSFSPVNRLLASCSADQMIKIWNLATSTCVHTLEGHCFERPTRLIFHRTYPYLFRGKVF